MKTKEKTIGIEVPFPSEKCQDKKCPFHGATKIRGRTFIGEVVSKDTHKSAVVKWSRQHYLTKYERYEKRMSKVHVHNPGCISCNVGDIVKIVETKPISKTKHYVIVQRIDNEKNNG